MRYQRLTPRRPLAPSVRCRHRPSLYRPCHCPSGTALCPVATPASPTSPRSTRARVLLHLPCFLFVAQKHTPLTAVGLCHWPRGHIHGRRRNSGTQWLPLSAAILFPAAAMALSQTAKHDVLLLATPRVDAWRSTPTVMWHERVGRGRDEPVGGLNRPNG